MFSYTVACSCNIIFWGIDYFFAMRINYVFHVGHAAVAYFNVGCLDTITPRKKTVTSFLTFLEILWFCCIIYHIYHHITCDTTGKVAREVGEIGP